MTNYPFFLIFLILGFMSRAQDTLYFKNKDKVTIVLLEVNPENIKYKRFDNQAGAIYTVLKTEIDQIVLSNGKKEVFTTPARASDGQTDSIPASVTPVANTSQAPVSDSLIFRSGKRLSVKIYELSPTEVRYKLTANLDGPVYKINKSELSEIIFSSGLKQKIAADPMASADNHSSNSSASVMAIRGAKDARVYYRNKGGSIGTGIVSAIFPPAGLIPAFICANNPPKDHNLGYPDENLWSNRDYKASYSKEAYRIKRKRVWTGFGIGAGIFLLLFLASH